MPDTIYIDPSATNASVIQINGECFERVGPSDHVPTVSSADYEFETCEKCERDIFTLVDCDGVEDDVVVDNPDWGQHVGKVFDVDGTCRTVTEGGNPNGVVDKSPGTPEDSCIECWGCENSIKCGNCCYNGESKIRVQYTAYSGYVYARGTEYELPIPSIPVNVTLPMSGCGTIVEAYDGPYVPDLDGDTDPHDDGKTRTLDYTVQVTIIGNKFYLLHIDGFANGGTDASAPGNCCTYTGDESSDSNGTLLTAPSFTVVGNGCCQNASNQCEDGPQDCATGDCTDDGGGA